MGVMLQGRFLVVMEHIARYSGWLAWDELGRIVSYDNDIATICGYSRTQSLALKPMNSLFDSGDFTLGKVVAVMSLYCHHV